MTATVTVIHPENTAEPGIGVPELLAATGISYRQSDHWCRTGYLHAIGEDRPGSGQQRRFCETEVRIARAAKVLIDCGFNSPQALAYARRLIEGGQPLVLADSVVHIVLDGGAA